MEPGMMTCPLLLHWGRVVASPKECWPSLQTGRFWLMKSCRRQFFTAHFAEVLFFDAK